MLRHGKPEFPDGRKYIYGRTDYPLSADGIRQAKRIGEILSGVRFQRIISSDLRRAAETADIVAGMQCEQICETERDPMIREIDMGEWDGVARDDIKDRYADIFRDRGENIANVAAPGGETFARVRERGLGALDRIIKASCDCDRILMVAHGAIMWGMVSGLFDIPLGDIFRFGLDYCAVHLVEHSRTPRQWGQSRLVRYNWAPDLVGYDDDLISD
jgi:probable phosphoglycerate mutase